MTFSYTDPSNSNKDAVRFKIGDTDESQPLLQDEEINYLLERYSNNILMASIYSCKAIIAKLSKETNYSLGPERVDASDRVTAFKNLLKALQNEVPSKVPSGSQVYDPTFKIGFMDNE